MGYYNDDVDWWPMYCGGRRVGDCYCHGTPEVDTFVDGNDGEPYRIYRVNYGRHSVSVTKARWNDQYQTYE